MQIPNPSVAALYEDALVSQPLTRVTRPTRNTSMLIDFEGIRDGLGHFVERCLDSLLRCEDWSISLR